MKDVALFKNASSCRNRFFFDLLIITPKNQIKFGSPTNDSIKFYETAVVPCRNFHVPRSKTESRRNSWSCIGCQVAVLASPMLEKKADFNFRGHR